MKYIHLRNKYDGYLMPTGGMTVAYDVEGDHVYYAVAKCSHKDNYCKRVGRQIATGRFDKQLDQGTIKCLPLVGKPIDAVLGDING